MSVKLSYSPTVRERLGRVIVGYRKQHGLSHAEMARSLGISGSALSQYLNGHIPINTDFILGCAKVTRTEPAFLSPALTGFVLDNEAIAA